MRCIGSVVEVGFAVAVAGDLTAAVVVMRSPRCVRDDGDVVNDNALIMVVILSLSSARKGTGAIMSSECLLFLLLRMRLSLSLALLVSNMQKLVSGRCCPGRWSWMLVV